ncbi:peptidyl-prolyl cis-trans isomerase A (cyclophilin A) [Duganella sp. CF402]|uniref:peptidylprolyl isomerase n=1 Tax=unclassified Duganella TaxID=2636909 RepID=UPI0008C02C7E|nr:MULTISPECIES: peptidylprolyl isomerase [unclassified Duganella]RZT11058.1 peptidyl-prolyl cis-trans isomerase A (cyclophilin A) [Duganella sp. BK701]SEK83476.1 peptidyl-prolyl cis-trans isomerase A (cyclophilin A) [Duganella sp. CF402]
MYQKLMTALAGLTLSAAVLAAPAPTQVELKTTMGDIVLELNREKAPKSVDNFINYVKSGFYKGTIFHRVIDGFMIQGGGYDEKLKGKPVNKPVPIESNNGLSNVKYSLAMARMGDPNSATSQWFINVEDNGPLDYPGPDGSGGYTVFGKVIKGFETVDKIKGVLVDDKGIFQNIPVIPIVVKSATILKTPIQPKQ